MSRGREGEADNHMVHDDDQLLADGGEHVPDDDVDTLGLDWDEEANRGGADLDATSVAVSAITTPAALIPNDDDVDTLGLDWDAEANRGGAGPDTSSVAMSDITTPATIQRGVVQESVAERTAIFLAKQEQAMSLANAPLKGSKTTAPTKGESPNAAGDAPSSSERVEIEDDDQRTTRLLIAKQQQVILLATSERSQETTASSIEGGSQNSEGNAPSAGPSPPGESTDQDSNNASQPGAHRETPLNTPGSIANTNANTTHDDNNAVNVAELAGLLGIPVVEAEAVNPTTDSEVDNSGVRADSGELVATVSAQCSSHPMTPSSHQEEEGGGESDQEAGGGNSHGNVVIQGKSIPTVTICGKSIQRSTAAFVGVLFAMFALVVAIALPIALKSNETENNDLMGVQKEDPANKTEDPAEIQRREARERRRQVLLDILSPSVNGLNNTETSPSNHRAEALEWLVDDFPEDASNVTELLDYYPEWKMKQRYILALLYFSTNGPGWYAQLGFLSKENECMWKGFVSLIQGDKNVVYGVDGNLLNNAAKGAYTTPRGVKCNGKGRVDDISLGANNLVGTIPGEVADLSESLIKLNLMRNTISSTIPSSLSELENLETLNLLENCLTGVIPEDLSRLSMLSEARFSGNNDLRGNLNGFCTYHEPYKRDLHGEEKSYRENSFEKQMWIQADCGDCPGSTALIECTCCHCCDFDTMSCCEKWGEVQEVAIWYELETFNRGECSLNDVQRTWKDENCPCFHVTPGFDSYGKYDIFICSTDCPV